MVMEGAGGSGENLLVRISFQGKPNPGEGIGGCYVV